MNVQLSSEEVEELARTVGEFLSEGVKESSRIEVLSGLREKLSQYVARQAEFSAEHVAEHDYDCTPDGCTTNCIFHRR